jgi:hypothetical protein
MVPAKSLTINPESFRVTVKPLFQTYESIYPFERVKICRPFHLAGNPANSGQSNAPIRIPFS